ncbi:MAG TPA: undecaprenyl-diphosphate phosphatase [Acidobacteriaceae bacterium]|jgi:undecaprenyl-diphosphatase|nr:undecaprenyl-diphosphate phosphatase [Acidobacteriaceae bacterium]
MSLLQVILLAIVQGLAELLPVSSSAHVVVAEKLMGLDPSSPAMTLLLVMLHTGTMFAVIVYFWKQWRATYFSSVPEFKRFAWQAILATVLTLVVGGAVIEVIEHTLFRSVPHAQIEDLFGHLEIVAPALFAAGILILIAGLKEGREANSSGADSITTGQAGVIGAVQGLCLPFRGFSRSGATISVGLLQDIRRSRIEAFSFALAVILTPFVVGREAMRLLHADHSGFAAAAFPSLLGALFSFLAGLVALKWLSSWLEKGRWYYFGIYCLIASVVVFALHHAGY